MNQRYNYFQNLLNIGYVKLRCKKRKFKMLSAMANLKVINEVSQYLDIDLHRKLAEIDADAKLTPVKVPKGKVYVVSELLSSGGHSKLLRAIMRADIEEKSLVITRGNNHTSSILEDFNANSIYCNFEVDDNLKIFQLLSQFQEIIVCAHPDDALLAWALMKLKQLSNVNVVYLNHADHVFQICLPYAHKVGQISNVGFRVCQDKPVESFYLGIPIDNFASKMHHEPSKSNTVRILSCGSSQKYRPIENCSWPSLALRLLKKNRHVNLTVVGPKVTDHWWYIAKLLYPIRLTLKSRLPEHKYQKELDKCNIYIDSFPMTGGTAFPEAWLRRAYVIGLKTGSSSYSITDVFKVDSYEKIEYQIQQFICSPFDEEHKYKLKSDEITSIFNYCHSPVECCSRLHLALRCSGAEPPSESVPFDGRAADPGFLYRGKNCEKYVVLDDKVITQICEYFPITSKLQLAFSFASNFELRHLVLVVKNLFTRC